MTAKRGSVTASVPCTQHQSLNPLLPTPGFHPRPVLGEEEEPEAVTRPLRCLLCPASCFGSQGLPGRLAPKALLPVFLLGEEKSPGMCPKSR